MGCILLVLTVFPCPGSYTHVTFAFDTVMWCPSWVKLEKQYSQHKPLLSRGSTMSPPVGSSCDDRCAVNVTMPAPSPVLSNLDSLLLGMEFVSVRAKEKPPALMGTMLWASEATQRAIC